MEILSQLSMKNRKHHLHTISQILFIRRSVISSSFILTNL